MDLVEITPGRSGVELDLAYASENNFTGRPVYGRTACYLHRDAAEHLDRVARLAGTLGLRFRIFDAFRPSEAQWVLWRCRPDPDFLADPRRGSPHSRGVAVDLTLIDDGGRALEMGTDFDAFMPRSHHGDLEVTPQAQRNRALLLGLMTAAGWDFYQKEWWHYQLFDQRRYPVLGDTILEQGMM